LERGTGSATVRQLIALARRVLTSAPMPTVTLSAAEQLIPGFRHVWAQIRSRLNVRTRSPKVVLTPPTRLALPKHSSFARVEVDARAMAGGRAVPRVVDPMTATTSVGDVSMGVMWGRNGAIVFVEMGATAY
jgi:hypothetical protein